MCKVFPSSLGSVAIRWFDSLAEGSINSFEEFTRTFGARFLTCTRVPRPLDSLLSLSIREGETLKTYFDRYWELYIEIDGDFEYVAVWTFKVGLTTNSDLWKSLTMKPPRNVHQLMDRTEEHKRVEDNQSSTRGKSKVYTNDRRDNLGGRFSFSRPRREYYNQPSHESAAPKLWNRCLRNRYIKFWIKLDTNHILNG